MRFYYYATPLPDGQWALHSSLESEPILHPTKEVAILDAKKNCRRHWEETRTPCGVRIRRDDNEWEDHYLVGESPDEVGDAQRSSESEPDVGWQEG